MPYHKLIYHFVWSTKYREANLTRSVRARLFRYMREKVEELGGTVLALNGSTDHVHLVARLPSAISVSRFIGQVKGYASRMFNASGHPAAPIYWQVGYGAFTVSPQQLAVVIRYVERQELHHRRQEFGSSDKDSG